MDTGNNNSMVYTAQGPLAKALKSGCNVGGGPYTALGRSGVCISHCGVVVQVVV